MSQSAVYPNSPTAARAVAGLTIGAIFSDPNALVTAVTSEGANTMYINPSLIFGSLKSNEGFLIHEMLHELGLSDGDIGRGLQSIDSSIVGPDQNNTWTNTKQFSDKFTKDCVSGKGNN